MKKFQHRQLIKVRQSKTADWVTREFAWTHGKKTYCQHISCKNKLVGWNYAENI